MTLKRMIRFFEKWSDKEYDALVAQYTERNEQRYQNCLKELLEFYDDELLVDVNRPLSPDERWYRSGEDVVGHLLMRRIIFQIKEYDHPNIGLLWRCYTSHTTRSKDGQADYFSSIFASMQENAPKIVSKYNIEEDATFLTHGLSEWNFRGGIELEELGELVDVYKIEKPSSKRDSDEYNSE